jgi:hypothetical protein
MFRLILNVMCCMEAMTRNSQLHLELFFLDEVTAFAAGHRPCAHSQRARHREFKEAWLGANVAEELRASTLMSTIDRGLHAERCIPGGSKVTFDAPLVELPRAAMFEHEDVAYLVGSAGYLPWSFDGYGEPKVIDAAALVKVLTRKFVIRAVEEGFIPTVHSSPRIYDTFLHAYEVLAQGLPEQIRGADAQHVLNMSYSRRSCLKTPSRSRPLSWRWATVGSRQ